MAAAGNKAAHFPGQFFVTAFPARERTVKNLAMEALHCATAPQHLETGIEPEECGQQILLGPERQVVDQIARVVERQENVVGVNQNSFVQPR